MHLCKEKLISELIHWRRFSSPHPMELQSSGRLGLRCQWISNAERILTQDLYNSFEHAMPKTWVEALFTNMCKSLVS